MNRDLIHVVLGATSSDPDVYGHHIPEGIPEWQFSDGPPGERSSSEDFLSLEEGLRACVYRNPNQKFVFHF